VIRGLSANCKNRRGWLNRLPGLAYCLGQELVGFGSSGTALRRGSSGVCGPSLKAILADGEGAGGAVRGLNVGVWLLARAHAFEELSTWG